MRKRFEAQLFIGQIPIEKVKIPTNSRDELPPVLAGLQWIFVTPEINQQIFELLENKIDGGLNHSGRPGMNLWHILVLGVVRLALNCDYDRLEYLVHYDMLMRQIMGLEAIGDEIFGKGFHQKTISQNVCYVDKELLDQINLIVIKEGRELFKKKEDEKIEAKTDSYVMETNVHFPTDANLLWDACRKCIQLLSVLCGNYQIVGWRKGQDWERKLKGLMRQYSRISHAGGANKKQRLDHAVQEYLKKAYELDAKVYESLTVLKQCVLSFSDLLKVEEIEYFHEMLIKHIDLLDRRVIKDEKIPHSEKVFSLFELHTEWVNKGKMRPPIELGHKILLTTDQYGLVLDYKVMDQSVDNIELLPLVDRLFQRYGEDSIGSLSMDKGFSKMEDRELLELFIPEVIMEKRGRRTIAESQREKDQSFRKLRHKHNAIESNINCIEHHGLNRCPDKGLNGFERYAGFGVLAYNLHKVGNELLRRRKKSLKKAA